MSTAEFYGESFELRSYVSDYALGKFAKAAAEGGDSATLEGYAALMSLVEKCITVEDWPRFDRLADVNEAEFDDLIPIINAAIRQATGRPTGRPSDSSDGPPTTNPKSESSVDVSDLERLLPGRPDKQLGILRMLAAQSA